MSSPLDTVVAQLTRDQEIEEVRIRLQSIRARVATLDRTQRNLAAAVDKTLSRAYHLTRIG